MDNPPLLTPLLTEIGEVGQQLARMQSAEGAAGNISVWVRGPLAVGDAFPGDEPITLPQPAPELAGGAFLVTGSGTRLRDAAGDAEENIGILVVEPGGENARLRTSPARHFARLTSEFNSHLAVHYEQARGGADLHAVVHAQPPYLTYLSHIPAYQDEAFLNQRLFRWQPETILQMPEGIAALPFIVPGSKELVAATRLALQDRQLAVWSGHGVMARADSLSHACDLVEYAEAAARYEYLNLAAGEPAQGLAPEDIRAIARAASLDQKVY